ncbi:DUF6666 family protein [Candidatus Laterigemmans baculatus]|uniref:DUF6666 family protein n=1 Tax=Candidatus Laterigemmans baculatus TaxID=2770505 RepID=UPI0013DD5721|nr:DUF6666 family protein [Candidatus Laterigemmans baculatus]
MHCSSLYAGAGNRIGCGAEFCLGCGAEDAAAGEVGCGLEGASLGGREITGGRAGWQPGQDGSCAAANPQGEFTFLCLPVPRVHWCRSEFFAGVQSFAGQANYAALESEREEFRGSSSFGAQYGMNFTRPLAVLDEQASMQLGVRGAVSNFAGADFTDASRRQVFLTGGFFRRVDFGLQGGVVADFLHDDWYAELNLSQLRGEISWRTARCNEFGFGYMAGLTDDASRSVILEDGAAVADRVEMEVINQNRLFYRRHFHGGGFAEAFAGLSGDDDGLLGASLELPLRSGLTLRSGVTYLVPEESSSRLDHQDESWNLALAFVWYPCGGCSATRYQRPLMDVADNGTFLFDRQ